MDQKYAGCITKGSRIYKVFNLFHSSPPEDNSEFKKNQRKYCSIRAPRGFIRSYSKNLHDDFDPAVLFLSFCCVVWSDWMILPIPVETNSSWLYTILFEKICY